MWVCEGLPLFTSIYTFSHIQNVIFFLNLVLFPDTNFSMFPLYIHTIEPFQNLAVCMTHTCITTHTYALPPCIAHPHSQRSSQAWFSALTKDRIWKKLAGSFCPLIPFSSSLSSLKHPFTLFLYLPHFLPLWINHPCFTYIRECNARSAYILNTFTVTVSPSHLRNHIPTEYAAVSGGVAHLCLRVLEWKTEKKEVGEYSNIRNHIKMDRQLSL